MPADRMECALAVLAVMCVLGIFFFPAVQGPYPVVHGPVTALLSIRAAASLRFRIVSAGLAALRDRLHRACAVLAVVFWMSLCPADLQSEGLAAGCNSVLRC